MTEKLLQFIWQFQYFNRSDLQLETGGNLQIIYPGRLNSNQGPDFLEAKIRLDNTIWIGNIELHVRTSDWDKHAHAADKNYQNVILHVVWENDVPVSKQQTALVILQHRVSKLLLGKYEEWMDSVSFIPCEKTLSQVNEVIWVAWKPRLLVERLQRRSESVQAYLEQNHSHWEEIFWWLLAKNFGYTINAEAFEAVAKTIQTAILAKHKNQIIQLEALLMGQAGLLDDDFQESYPTMLKKEYRFLKKKYQLQPVRMPVHFLRMRPGNFPTIRLAQLAVLVQQSSHLFSKIKEQATLHELFGLFTVTANDYWNYHYVFDTAGSFSKKLLGRQRIENIIINTIVPVLFAYGHRHGEAIYKEKALQWLEELRPENNHIISGWKVIGVENRNAFDSQALIELKTRYCDNKRCLECAIGNALLKSSSDGR